MKCWLVKTPMRRYALALVISCFVTGCVHLEKSETSAIQFIVIGDWGDGGSEAQRQVAESMEVLATKHRIDFVVTTGDNIYPHGVNGVDDTLWDQQFVDVYSSQNLQQLNWYAVLGNHDYHGDYESQIGYQAINPRWRLPSTYYQKSWSIGAESSILIAFTDTNPYIEEYRLRQINTTGFSIRTQRRKRLGCVQRCANPKRHGRLSSVITRSLPIATTGVRAN